MPCFAIGRIRLLKLVTLHLDVFLWPVCQSSNPSLNSDLEIGFIVDTAPFSEYGSIVERQREWRDASSSPALIYRLASGRAEASSSMMYRTGQISLIKYRSSSSESDSVRSQIAAVSSAERRSV
jgi:hypothetical protein